MVLGYIRVSTKDQNTDRQILKMKELGIEDRFLFIDKANSRNFDRPEYITMKRILRTGDLIYIDALDRLGRNYVAIKKEWQHIVHDLGCDVVILENPDLFDSRKFKSMGEIGRLLEDQFLSLLSYVAEKELKRIKKNQADGIAAAKLRGVKLGRPKVIRPENFNYYIKKWKSNEISAVQCMKILNLKKSTFYNLVKNEQ